LALISFDINPRNISNIDCVDHIMGFFNDSQIGNPLIIQDDIFGILSLLSAGINKDHEIIRTVSAHIIEQQQDNGAWGDVDTTAAALMALHGSGENITSPSIQHGINFIQSQQSSSGGFTSWGSTNTATTSWVLSCLTALDQDPLSDEWRKNGNSPVSYLLSMQQPDGSFYYTGDTSSNPAWMTAYTVISLTGHTYLLQS
jgi:prenyltransferase beta subunit